MSITSFRNDFFFLSNFYPIEIVFIEKTYKSAEHAFQAAKCANNSDVEKIRKAKTPAIAKSIGRHVQMKANWESEKVKVMEQILRIKFQNRRMRMLLNRTKDHRIVEQNSWHDTYWGVCTCRKHECDGKNILGELLMLIRDSDILYPFF